MEKTIKKNFLFSFILTGANYIFPLIVYPYVSRVLGVNNIGACNFVSSLVQYFILFSMLGIETVGVREIAACKGDKDKLSRCFSNIFTINTILTLFALILYVAAILFFPQLQNYSKLMWIGAIQLVFNYMLIDWLYKGLEDFRYVTIRTIIVRCLYVISVFLFVRHPEDYDIYFLLTCLTIAFNAVINCIFSRRYLHFTLNGFRFTEYLAPIIILGVYGLLTSMYTTFNTAFLGFSSGNTEVGYYTTATKLFSFALAAFTALTGVMLPRMSALLSYDNRDEFSKLLTRTTDILISFSVPVIFFSLVFAPDIIMLISGEGYEGAILPMRIVMPLIFIIGYEQILVTQTLMPLKKDRAILINSLIGAFIGIIGNFALVPCLASVGSSVVWIVSELAVLVSAQLFVKKYLSRHFPIGQFLRFILLYLPLLVFLLTIKQFIDNYLIRLFVGIASLTGYFFIVNRTLVKSFK